MKIKKVIALSLFACMMLSVTSCKKFLNVTPIQAQSGNNFWKTRQDVEDFTNGIYAQLREKVAGRPAFFRSYDKMFFPAIELRNNNVTNVSALESAAGTNVVNALIANNMRFIVSAPAIGANNHNPNYPGILRDIMSWDGWYDIIASSNIMYAEVDNVPANAISDADRLKYKAEAVFLRNLSYMYICKLFGDAVYYTEPYHTKSLPRTPQVQVLNKCIADLKANFENLPLEYSDPTAKGMRPTRGAAVALMMHLNMWAAAFDNGDKKVYYTAVTELAKTLDTYTNYRLLTVNEENTKLIFKGRSDENLFSILQDNTLTEGFSIPATYSNFVSHTPITGKVGKVNSSYAYTKSFIEKIFVPGVADNRVTVWFENYNSGTGTFQFKKFNNLVSEGSGLDTYTKSDDSAIIFRLPDCLLLAAEAFAELNDDENAKLYANRVREVANALPLNTTGEDLKKDIYYERCRELIGEGQYSFDLIRTRRITDSEYTANPMTVSNFNAGAWTWPLTISTQERAANPYLVGNNFWN
ncbi:RagB/SusD family nutrient uptake outer membrane protein [Pedobacter sp. MC2016-05]|uniref:RagB/SusD family nutrient uptake outer membrane protein n=1 Tax=Pedobacter sp. MC2016-05 TaxID=2994474 RepID=UPI0022474D06|nr:RagB/SusD family nutrient uptake outer membrane protein [Pedobacter sp. MC2016-05]MCX2473759.1 RagB/SusD family nutrient uptake outer membrane protein [Pedobacter sp. MC2016-05]